MFKSRSKQRRQYSVGLPHHFFASAPSGGAIFVVLDPMSFQSVDSVVPADPSKKNACQSGHQTEKRRRSLLRLGRTTTFLERLEHCALSVGICARVELLEERVDVRIRFLGGWRSARVRVQGQGSNSWVKGRNSPAHPRERREPAPRSATSSSSVVPQQARSPPSNAVPTSLQVRARCKDRQSQAWR